MRRSGGYEGRIDRSSLSDIGLRDTGAGQGGCGGVQRLAPPPDKRQPRALLGQRLRDSSADARAPPGDNRV
jgi:hypothetical protein